MQPSKAPFIPAYLAKCGLKPGEWMNTSKLTVKTLLRPDMDLKVQIIGALLLQAHGYESDLAVVMKRAAYAGGKAITEPLSPNGIASIIKKHVIEAYRESGQALPPEVIDSFKITRQHMRRALEEREESGLIIRVRSNGPKAKLIGLSLNEALEKGLVTPLEDLAPKARQKVQNSICVYLLAKPRPAKSYVANTGYINEANPFSSGPTQLWFRYTRDAQLAGELANSDEGQSIYQAIITAKDNLKLAEQAARELAQRKALRAMNPPPLPADDVADGQVSLFPTPTASSPADLVSQPRRHTPKTISELAPIADVLTRWIEQAEHGKAWIGGALIFDDAFLKKLFAECRDAAPDCTPEEVAFFADHRLAIKLGKKVPNPYGYLMAAVPQAFEGDALQRLRAKGDGQRKQSPAAAALCSKCEGSGLIGLQWEKIGDAVDLVAKGAKICDCPEGETTRMIAEPALMRRSAS